MRVERTERESGLSGRVIMIRATHCVCAATGFTAGAGDAGEWAAIQREQVWSGEVELG